MRAVVCDRYGPPDVLRIDDVERPAPKEDEVLVRVHATTVNRTDCGIRGAHPFFVRAFTGLRRPKQRIPGMEFAGVVEAVGAAVTEFKAGERVFGIRGAGAHAEYVCVREGAALAHIPAGWSFEEAAPVPDGACIALSCFRKAEVGEGRSILVYGATGSVGTAGVQLAKYFGAAVTAVGNTRNIELVRSLGADRVIDYLSEDFAADGATYDVIFDAYGKLSFRRARSSLKPGGTFIATDGLRNLFFAPATRLRGDKRLTFGIAKYRKEDVRFLAELMDAGQYRAVIDRTYPLEDVVEATRYVETGEKTGNVVLTVVEPQQPTAAADHREEVTA